MVKLPINVDIHNLIDDLRIFSWEAADILIYYSKMLKDSDFKKDIIQNTNLNDPVTLADLKVSEIIINGKSEVNVLASYPNADTSGFQIKKDWRNLQIIIKISF